MADRNALHTLVFNSLEEQIAVIDQGGVIVEVNASWENFGIENGLSPNVTCVGSNYLEIVRRSGAAGDVSAAEATQGIGEVLSGERAGFYHEYPCHSPTEKRWFMMRVSRLKGDSMGMIIISHSNITKRRLAEARAEHLARHDSLTGLANRRYFNEFLDLEMNRSIRNKSTTSLIVIDIDYFKDYNDDLGHAAGDLCLAKLGEVLRAFSRRPGDLAARLGGDEFALVLGETDVAESEAMAHAIRRAICDVKLVFGGSRQVTVSVSVASVTPDRQQGGDFLFREADKALYRAKSEGRNGIARVPPEID